MTVWPAIVLNPASACTSQHAVGAVHGRKLLPSPPPVFKEWGTEVNSYRWVQKVLQTVPVQVHHSVRLPGPVLEPQSEQALLPMLLPERVLLPLLEPAVADSPEQPVRLCILSR
jgi:hypothetical protein